MYDPRPTPKLYRDRGLYTIENTYGFWTITDALPEKCYTCGRPDTQTFYGRFEGTGETMKIMWRMPVCAPCAKRYDLWKPKRN